MATKPCRNCQQYYTLNLFVKSKAFKSGYDTICLTCSREKVKAWRIAGKRNAAKEYASAVKRRGEEFLEKQRQRQAAYYAKKRVPRKFKTYEELRATKNYHQGNRRVRYQAKLWDKELTSLVLKEAYSLAKLRDTMTNLKWHVDHIVPLQGKTVSGLHVWNNVQVIPAQINRKKWNYYGE